MASMVAPVQGSKLLSSSSKTQKQSQKGIAAFREKKRLNSSARSRSSPNLKNRTSGGMSPKSTTATRVESSSSTHVVRVNVLGLAGITVDRAKCKDSAKRKDFPQPPSEMRAVVAFSRGQEIRGTTTVSKPLRRSPNDDIVLAGNRSEEDDPLRPTGRANKSTDSGGSASAGTQTTDVSKLQRHVAVWAADDDLSLGSMVTFEATLHRFETGASTTGTAMSTAYAPKSFELTVALTENKDSVNKVALPFGVATLNITGDECPFGETLVLDLPILSIVQARPLSSNENGLRGYQMIAIRPKGSSKPSPDKKRGLKRFFGRGNVDSKPPKVPSVAERKMFSEAYATDPSGDSILRVQLQVLEKGVSSEFKKAQYEKTTLFSPGMVPREAVKEKKSNAEEKTVAADSKAESEQAGSTTSYTGSSFESSDGDSATFESFDSQTFHTEGSATLETDGSTTLNTDGSTTLPSINSTTIGESSAPGGHDRLQDNSQRASRHGEQNKGFDDRPTEIRTPAFSTGDDDDLIIFKVFGKSVSLPSCGPIIEMRGNGQKARFFNDDMTHVTADFFGQDIPIPICATIKPVDDDDTISLLRNDTFETMSEYGFTGRLRDEVMRHFHLTKKLNEETPDPTQWIPHDAKSRNESTIDDATLDVVLDGSVDLTYASKRGPPSPEDGTHDGTPGSHPAGSMQQQPIELVSKGSPKGVADLEPSRGSAERKVVAEAEQMAEQNSIRSVSQKIAELFRCETTNYVDDKEYEVGVPGMVIPSETGSVGELTANSGLVKLNPRGKRRSKRSSVPLPVAFGGSGLCSGIELVDASAVQESRIEVAKSSSYLGPVAQRGDENYFHEYDDYSFVGVRENIGVPAQAGTRAHRGFVARSSSANALRARPKTKEQPEWA